MKTLEEKASAFAEKTSPEAICNKGDIETAYIQGSLDQLLLSRGEIGKFSQVIQSLKGGYCVARKEWGQKCFITKQIPADIAPDIIPNMQSLPSEAKRIMERMPRLSLHYTDQVLIIYPDNQKGCMATSYVPDWQDIFAEDWYILD